MKKTEKIETPLLNIERHPLIVVAAIVLSLGFVYLTYFSVVEREAFEVKPLSFLLIVPTLFICFQTLWFILHPFGIVYEDRIEVRKSFLNFKQWFFIDIKKVGTITPKGIIITYNDDEMERINLLGIKSSHKKLIQEAFVKYVNVSLEKRGVFKN